MIRHFSRFVLLTLIMLAAPLLGGCGSLLSGVQVQSEKTIAKPPGSVIVYLRVKDGDEPVAHLTKNNFEIYENGVLLDRAGLHIELLPRDTAAAGHTVLLLDLSGELDQSDLNRIARGAGHFVQKVSTTQSVSVLVFDGSEKPRLVARFPKVDAEEQRELPELTPFVTGDDSRNLNGAVLEALKVLDQELNGSPKPVRRGSLVTVTRGPDLAARSSDDEIYSTLKRSPYELYALRPKGSSIPTIRSIGADGAYEYDTRDTMPLRLLDLGLVVRGAWEQHYILTYCSPARGGQRDVRVALKFQDDHGERSGSVRTGFDASGFESGCGPLRPVLQAKKDEEERELLAQKAAEAEAAEELRRAEEAAEARKKDEEARRKAQAAQAAARRTLEGDSPSSSDEEPPEALEEEEAPDGVVAPPSSDDYE